MKYSRDSSKLQQFALIEKTLLVYLILNKEEKKVRKPEWKGNRIISLDGGNQTERSNLALVLAPLRQWLHCTRGTSGTTARILQPYNIRVAHKPATTLWRLITNVKGKDKLEDRQGAVYKINCCDCQATYVGETGTWLTEHKRVTRNGDINNNIPEHYLQTKHHYDRDLATYITYSTYYYQRLTLESSFTNLEQTPLNYSQQLPTPYKRLIDGIKQNELRDND